MTEEKKEVLETVEEEIQTTFNNMTPEELNPEGVIENADENK